MAKKTLGADQLGIAPAKNKEHRKYIDQKWQKTCDAKLTRAIEGLRRITAVYETGVIAGSREAMYERARKTLEEINEP
jgi:hypothetical protein